MMFSAKSWKVFSGEYCVSFIGGLLDEYFGFNPLPRISSKHSPQRGVLLLRHYNHLWAATSWGSDDFLTPLENHDMRCLIDELGANTVFAGVGRRGRVYTTRPPGRGDTISRVITRGIERNSLPIEFSITCLDEVLHIDINVLDPPIGQFEHVRLDLSGCICEWVFKLPEGISWLEGVRWKVDARFDEGSYGLRWAIPQDLSEDLSPRNRSIPVLLTVYRTGAGRETDVMACTLIPLSVVRGE